MIQLLGRDSEKELCLRPLRTWVALYSPLARGVLTGKYDDVVMTPAFYLAISAEGTVEVRGSHL
jgi:aryl-alcohol dehydrogenase-like predicted oxidoreductase